MNILLIGYENDIDLAWKAAKLKDQITVAVLGNCIIDANILDYQLLSSYGCIIVAIKELSSAQDFSNLLKCILNDTQTAIINFYAMYHISLPVSKVDRVMSNPFRTDYNGMILGISHAEVGILPQLLHGNFCNLAVSSQDIYYNMKTLKHCMDHYKSKIQNLHYLIFDMYDYTYFNYDASLCKAANKYYNIWGGFRNDPHNFNNNSSFKISFNDLILHAFAVLYPDISTEKINLWDTIFEDIHAVNNYQDFNEYSYAHLQLHKRVKYVTDMEIEAYTADASIVQKTFPDTIRENTQYFHNLLQYAYTLNPHMKIFCILIPRYYAVQEKVQSVYAPWKELFYNIMEETQKAYPYTFLDLTNDEISKKREYYFDTSHFNYYRAIKFTQYLNSLIMNSII